MAGARSVARNDRPRPRTDYAFELHAAQRRKGSDGVDGPPYVGHLLAVAGMVIDEGGSEAEAIAALLHDAAEDQGGEERLEKIERRFGPEVAGIVRECSDTTSVEKEDWALRKDRYIDSIAGKSDAAVRVSMADKLHNAHAIARDYHAHGDAVWGRFTPTKEDIARYYRRLLEAYRARLAGCEDRYPYLAAFASAVDAIESAAGAGAS